MTSLQELSPAERARLLGKPDGETGLALAEWMNDFNRPFMDAAGHCLALENGCSVLEVGFGNGHHLPNLLAGAETIKYAGVDISPTMVEEAARFNHPLVASGQAQFYLGNIETLPFAPASFDRVVVINVIYFWPDPVKPLAALRRALQPQGISVIGASDPSSQKAAYVQPEYGFHPRDAATLVAMHRQAGFHSVEVMPIQRTVAVLDGTVISRLFNLIISRP